jgi:hypothetical protein
MLAPGSRSNAELGAVIAARLAAWVDEVDKGPAGFAFSPEPLGSGPPVVARGPTVRRPSGWGAATSGANCGPVGDPSHQGTGGLSLGLTGSVSGSSGGAEPEDPGSRLDPDGGQPSSDDGSDRGASGASGAGTPLPQVGPVAGHPSGPLRVPAVASAAPADSGTGTGTGTGTGQWMARAPSPSRDHFVEAPRWVHAAGSRMDVDGHGGALRLREEDVANRRPDAGERRVPVAVRSAAGWAMAWPPGVLPTSNPPAAAPGSAGPVPPAPPPVTLAAAAAPVLAGARPQGHLVSGSEASAPRHLVTVPVPLRTQAGAGGPTGGAGGQFSAPSGASSPFRDPWGGQRHPFVTVPPSSVPPTYLPDTTGACAWAGPLSIAKDGDLVAMGTSSHSGQRTGAAAVSSGGAPLGNPLESPVVPQGWLRPGPSAPQARQGHTALGYPWDNGATDSTGHRPWAGSGGDRRTPGARGFPLPGPGAHPWRSQPQWQPEAASVPAPTASEAVPVPVEPRPQPRANVEQHLRLQGAHVSSSGSSGAGVGLGTGTGGGSVSGPPGPSSVVALVGRPQGPSGCPMATCPGPLCEPPGRPGPPPQAVGSGLRLPGSATSAGSLVPLAPHQVDAALSWDAGLTPSGLPRQPQGSTLCASLSCPSPGVAPSPGWAVGTGAHSSSGPTRAAPVGALSASGNEAHHRETAVALAVALAPASLSPFAIGTGSAPPAYVPSAPPLAAASSSGSGGGAAITHPASQALPVPVAPPCAAGRGSGTGTGMVALALAPSESHCQWHRDGPPGVATADGSLQWTLEAASASDLGAFGDFLGAELALGPEEVDQMYAWFCVDSDPASADPGPG